VTATLTPERSKLIVTTGLVIGVFLAALESTVVATAMPSVIESLGGAHLYSLPFAVYLLSSTISGPLWGRVSDLYGRKPFYLVSILLFVFGSLMCGLSDSMEFLILGRVVQGIGSGGVMPLTLTLIATLYSLKERPKVQGFISGAWGVSGLLGPLLGGVIADKLSWRWAFFLCLPFAVAALLIHWRYYRDSAIRQTGRVDWYGAATFGLGTGLLIWSLEASDARFALAAVPVLALFAWLQTRVPNPILPVRAFTSSLVRLGLLGNFFAGMAYFGLIAYLPLYAQRVSNSGATAAGAVLTPMIVAWTISATISARLLPRLGTRSLTLIGATLIVLGFAAFRLTLGEPLYVTSLIGALVGLGMGFTMLTLLVSVQSSVPQQDLGVVTSSILFARTVAGSIGSAAMGALIGGSLTQESLGAFTEGIGRAFLLALGLAGATWVIAFLLPKQNASRVGGDLVSTD
jgi:EmrB/QacA subfamily drug resistance transporter